MINDNDGELQRKRSDVSQRSSARAISVNAKTPYFSDHEVVRKYRHLGAQPGMHVGADQDEVNVHRHMLQLEMLMNYLMSENQFFRCLQVEVYLYFAAIFLFFVLTKNAIELSPGRYVSFSTPLQPIAVLYIIFLIKYINKLYHRLDVVRSSYCLAVISCYLAFIVACSY